MRKSLGISIIVLVFLSFTSQALAQQGRGRNRRVKQKNAAVPYSKNIKPALDDVEWGWSHEKVIEFYTLKIKKMYRPMVTKASDAMTEDRLRREMKSRIARIKRSYVEFNGQATGWDTSLISDEYTHKNGESLLEVREPRAGRQDPRYTDYLFFINNKLWKRYRAFNQDQFQGIAFSTVAKSFQKRFGKARRTKGSNGALVSLEWQDRESRLRAIDNTEFYGVFCLIFSDKETERNLDSLRTNKGTTKKTNLNPLVEALRHTEGTRDAHSNIVEHITGKRYETSKNQDKVKGSRGSKRKKRNRRNVFKEEIDRPEKNRSGNILGEF